MLSLKKTPWLVLFFTLLICPSVEAQTTEQQTEPAFTPRERLVFTLKWENVPAGTGILEVMPDTEIKGAPALHFRGRAWTNSFADVFYKVRDQIDGYAAPDLSKSLYYTQRQRENDYNRDIEVTFDWKRMRAHHLSSGEHKESVALLPGALDQLSVYYYMRSLDIRLNRDVLAVVTDGEKCVIGRAEIVRFEWVDVPAGRFWTFLVEPEIKHLGGVFRKSPDAKIQVWITADHRHIPVKGRSKVSVGHFNFVLEEILTDPTRELAVDVPPELMDKVND